jgi:predicted MFS family arabinose efflux permease
MKKILFFVAWLIASMFYAYQYVLRVMPNIMIGDIIQRFHVDTAVFGQFSGAYYLGYCVFHIPIGIMLDRFGPAKVMSICVLLTSLGMLPIIFSEHFIYPILGRFLIGLGSSAAILGAFKIIRLGFQEKHFTRMLSFCVTIGLCGAIYGGVPINYFTEHYGYKVVVLTLSCLGILFAIATYYLVPDIKKEVHADLKADLKLVFSNYKVLTICFLAGIMVGPMEGFADAWGSEFLKQVYKIDIHNAHYLTSMIYIGMCFAPVLSRIAEKTKAYFATIVGAGLVMSLVFLLLLAQMLNFYTIFLGFFLVGICCAYQILVIYEASSYVPARVIGLTTAVANMIIMSFGYLFHSSIGLVIKFFNASGSSLAYSYGIAIIPATLMLGTIGFYIFKLAERRP